MNERIKLLITQTGGIGHDDDGNELTPILVGTSLEIFAELIVKECGQWIIDNASAMEHLGPEYFAQAMIKDFGANI